MYPMLRHRIVIVLSMCCLYYKYQEIACPRKDYALNGTRDSFGTSFRTSFSSSMIKYGIKCFLSFGFFVGDFGKHTLIS